MPTCACGYAEFDVAVICLRIGAVVVEHAQCELMPGPGRWLRRVRARFARRETGRAMAEPPSSIKGSLSSSELWKDEEDETWGRRKETYAS
jgi:hypothetical protein